MTSLALANSNAATTPINWSQWVRIDQAATLLGLDRKHLAGVCARQLEGKGVAVKTKAPGDSRVAWWLHRDHDTRLAARRGQAERIPTLEELGVSMDKASEARQRRECVRALRRWRVEQAEPMKAWLPRLINKLRGDHPGIRINRTGLLRWDQALRDEVRDLEQLVDRRGGGAARPASPKAWAYFEVEYLGSAASSLAECWRKTAIYAKDHGLVWCAKRTCEVQLNDRIPPAKQAFHRDRALYNSRYLPTQDQAADAHPAGRYWVADHTQLDFQVAHGQRLFRPFLTSFQDWRTRKVVGWTLSDSPNADTILLALREGLMDEANMGGPTEVGFDNGKDFDSLLFDGRSKLERRREKRGDFALETGAFRGILGELNITPHFSQPYGPNGKARKERWYGTLHNWLCKTMPSYVGKDTASKPHDHAEKIKAGKAPNWQQAWQRVSKFVLAYNNHAEHQVQDLREDGVSLSPNQAMAAWCRERRVFNDGALDLLLLHHDRPVTVTKRGVRVTIAGEVYHYGLMHPELIPYQGTRRRVRPAYDPQDVSSIKIFDEETNRLICVAHLNDKGGHTGELGRQKLSAFKRRSREHQKALKQVGLDGMIPAAVSALELRMERGELPESPEPVTESITPVSTRFDSQENQRQRAEMKAAAGAEHDELPTRRPIRRDILAALDAETPTAPTNNKEQDDLFDELAPLGRIGCAPTTPSPTPSPDESQEEDLFDVFDDVDWSES